MSDTDSRTWSVVEIEQTVMACVAESLARNPSEITLHKRLIGELGADSLDFLDIIFNLERRFSIQLRSDGLDRFLRADFSQSRLEGGVFVPAEDLARLQEWIPALVEAPDRAKVAPASLFTYITVESLVIQVQKKLQQTEPGTPHSMTS